MAGLQRQLDDRRREIDDLRRDLEPLRDSRRRVLYREVIVCAYSALGHNPRGTTFEYMKHHPAILQEAFGFSQGGIATVLDALDPRPSQSWIKLGNDGAHGFSIAEAERLVSDGTIRKLLHALTRHAEDESTL